MGSAAFLRNCWYVAAWDHEIGPEQLFQRTILGQSLLLFRTSAGNVVALDNKCCHRHAPLSLGRREGDCVRCMYHGLKFGPDGKCVEIPGQTAIAFDEDQRIVEAQQQLIDSTPASEMIGLIADTALANFRNLYQRALQKEHTDS